MDDNDNRPSSGMADNQTRPAKGFIGLVLGGAAVAAVAFILVGGQLGGEKKVHGDQDLPPVASPEKK